MIYRGKQIVVRYTNHTCRSFRGSAYTLSVSDKGSVIVYDHRGDTVLYASANELIEVSEGNYTGESL